MLRTFLRFLGKMFLVFLLITLAALPLVLFLTWGKGPLLTEFNLKLLFGMVSFYCIVSVTYDLLKWIVRKTTKLELY